MLHATPDLDAVDRRVVAEIDGMREQLRFQLGTPVRWGGQLRRSMAAHAIVGSNTIEGYRATVEDVEALLVGEEPTDGADAVTAEIAGYQQALAYIQSLSAARGFRYDAGLLNGLHFMLHGHHARSGAGMWRTGPVHVASGDGTVRYSAPDAADVPGLMAELTEWLNTGDLDAPVQVRASMAHLNLVGIHPWRDGNGRMSRALSTLVFSREDLMPAVFSSIEEWLGYPERTYEYYAVLREVGGPGWAPQRDAHAWVRFCLRAHHMQAQSAQRRLERHAQAWMLLEAEAAHRGLPERVVHALMPAALGRRIRRAVYQHDAGLGEQTATRDVRILVQLGLLRDEGAGRGRRYVAGPALVETAESVRRAPDALRDPYGDDAARRVGGYQA